MKLTMLRIITSLSLVVLGMGLLPAFGNGTVKSTICSSKKHRHYVKRHYYNPDCIEEPCIIEPACPTAVPPCNDLYYKPCNFYAGGQAGWLNMRGKFRDFLSSTGFGDKGLKTNNGVIGELLFGYRYFWFSGINLGLELAANLESTHLKKIVNPGILWAVKFEREYSIVPAIMVGRVFECQWNFFAKVGLGISRFETKVAVLATGNNFHSHKTELGVVPSMGMEYAINRELSVIGTLTYEYYYKVGTHFSNVLIAGDHGANTMKRIQYVATKVGFIAKF